ncbi:Glutathione S-transferase S1 [Linnemannia exigua]|uniref:Glutathione S-transferase S1 n=1 Tax=Linnemannia exigua TaxID=604196 RepID=A0AAD4D8N4_9FUNG|nr:Glutathione S-transferase S1 [Linnemannia exigua]
MAAPSTPAAPDATHLAYKNTDQLSVTLKEPTSFKLLYFPIHSSGATTREILSIAEAKWENLVPSDWEKEKEKTPFNVLPVLFITSQTNKDIILAEAAGVIEQYLAKQFRLMGCNDYEENLIKSFHSSTASLHSLHATTVAFIPDRDARKRAMEVFRDGPFRAWVTLHEKHLRDNGSNGYYVGDKLSLADIRTANFIEHMNLQTGGQALYDIINISPCLRKLCVEVAVDYKISRWRSSQAYKILTTATDHYFSDPFAPVSKL